MSYEYKDAAKNALYMAYALTRIPSDKIEQAYEELDEVYDLAEIATQHLHNLSIAEAKADEYEAKAKAFDEITFIYADSLAHDYDDHSIVQNIAKVIENEKGDYYV